ncbi:MFS transporter [Congregibacter brevis]|uniref:MFS transporter n=1 Tax=Congregibacter brevis TaxID=3081201 RepID=A0ABZ0IE81_9GAMM|nr:MFS transporter [Congregibacter sp. IMCC45268]
MTQLATTPNPFDRAPIILSALAISAIGALFYNVLPLYIGAAQDFRSLSNQQIGFISVAFFLGYNLATIWAFFWIRRWNWRWVTLAALPVALLGLLASGYAKSYYLLLLATVIAGGGFAALYGIGTTILADTSNPARWYGVKIAAETAPGAVLLFVIPSVLAPIAGFNATAYGIGIVALLLAPLLFLLPTQGRVELEVNAAADLSETDSADINRTPILTALAATLVFFSAASGMWAFIERMGVSGGFSPERIGMLLSITLVTATSGSLLTAWLGERLGNTRPFYAACGAFIVALLILGASAGFSSFALGTCVLTFAIGMGLPFAIAEVAELDADGRFIILSVPAIGMGAMLGPGLSGMLADAKGFSYVLVAAGVAIVIASMLMRYSSRHAVQKALATA